MGTSTLLNNPECSSALTYVRSAERSFATPVTPICLPFSPASENEMPVREILSVLREAVCTTTSCKNTSGALWLRSSRRDFASLSKAEGSSPLVRCAFASSVSKRFSAASSFCEERRYEGKRRIEAMLHVTNKDQRIMITSRTLYSRRMAIFSAFGRRLNIGVRSTYLYKYTNHEAYVVHNPYFIIHHLI